MYVLYDSKGHIRALVSQYVDDVMVAGRAGDNLFGNFSKSLESAYRSGSWEKNNFVQCGVEIAKVNNSFRLSQHKYAETLQPIEIHKQN